MRLIDTNVRINAVAPGATVTPAHLANKAGEQPGGAKMLEYSKDLETNSIRRGISFHLPVLTGRWKRIYSENINFQFNLC